METTQDPLREGFSRARNTVSRVESAVCRAWASPGRDAQALLLTELRTQRELLRGLIRLLTVELESQSHASRSSGRLCRNRASASLDSYGDRA